MLGEWVPAEWVRLKLVDRVQRLPFVKVPPWNWRNSREPIHLRQRLINHSFPKTIVDDTHL
eukprot:2624011-Amphidinium_carterae.3